MNYSKYIRKVLFAIVIVFVFFACSTRTDTKPNILFILMDDLGYGQFGIYNDTISVDDFNPFFV